MRVLMIYPNRYRLLPAAPLGAALVADRLRRDGHTVRLLDLVWPAKPTLVTQQTIREFRPELIAFSLRNRDGQSLAYAYDALPFARAVVGSARAVAPATPMLIGGTAFTTFPRQLMRELPVDFGYCGDDLEPVAQFVRSLESDAPDVSLPGIVHRQANGEIGINPWQIKGYADVAFDCYDLIDLKPYRRALGSFFDAAVVTRTGCPFNCAFCDAFVTFGENWVLRQPAQVAREVKGLRRRGVRDVWLADGGFNRPLDHAKAVLEAIIQADAGVRLHIILEPGEMDDEFARLFKRAGGSSATCFAGSLVDEVLVAQRKPFLAADALNDSRRLLKAGIMMGVMFSLGGPGETMASVRQTLALSGRDRWMFRMADYGQRLQPKTYLLELAVAEGQAPRDCDCFAPLYYFSPHTPRAWLAAEVARFNRSATMSLPGISLESIGQYAVAKLAAWLS